MFNINIVNEAHYSDHRVQNGNIDQTNQTIIMAFDVIIGFCCSLNINKKKRKCPGANYH